MRRKITCIRDGAEESSAAYASDPWCSDKCHAEVARLVDVPQGKLSTLVFYAAVDGFCCSPAAYVARSNVYDNLKEYVRAHLNYSGGLPASDKTPAVRAAASRPVDWDRRVLLLSQNPWGCEVRQLS